MEIGSVQARRIKSQDFKSLVAILFASSSGYAVYVKNKRLTTNNTNVFTGPFFPPLSNPLTPYSSPCLRLANLLHRPCKYLPSRPGHPLPRHAHSTPVTIADPSHKDGIGGRDFLFRRRGRVVATVLSGDFGGGDFAAAFRGLFLEEAVDGVHLFGGEGVNVGRRERGRGKRWCWAWKRTFEGVGLGENAAGNRGASEVRKRWEGFRDGGSRSMRKTDETYLFLLIALLAQVLAPAGHLGTAHSVFLGRKMFFGLRFCRNDI